MVSVEVACDCKLIVCTIALYVCTIAFAALASKKQSVLAISMWGALSSIKISSRWMHVFETGHAALRISRRDAASCMTRLSETQLPFRFQTCAVFCSLWCQDLCCVGNWLCRSLQHYTKAVTYECCSMTFISSVKLFCLWHQAPWHRALLQASADISHYIQGDGCFLSWSKSNYWNVSSAVLCTKVGTSEPRRFTAISKHHFVLVCVVKASACKSACV